MHALCLRTTRNVEQCGCEYRELQKLASDSDAKVIVEGFTNGKPLPPPIALMLLTAGAQCR
jgi:hypothetical protein